MEYIGGNQIRVYAFIAKLRRENGFPLNENCSFVLHIFPISWFMLVLLDLKEP